MQKSKFSLASTAAISLMLAISLPGSGQTQGVFEACSDELQNYCSQVTPGNGRLFACFYAHEDKLSEGCDAAIVDVADQLDMFFDVIRYAAQQCGDDIAKHCQEVELGGGRIYSCLKDSSDKLSDTCAEVIGQIELPAN
jgi:hypothetical protein